MPVTSLYLGILTLFLVVLSVRVIMSRRADKVSLGSGDSETLERRMRAQGNFIEYAPIGLLALALLEANDAAIWLLHLIGLMLTIGRLLHGYGMSFMESSRFCRFYGMILTFIALIGAGIANIKVFLF